MCLRVIIILLLAGCSVEPTTTTKGVADDNLILGAVVDGSNYSLVLCKTSPISDHRNCRPALLDSNGKAVVFSPEQIKMSLAEQLAGYSKGLAMIASVPLVLIGGRRLATFLSKKQTVDDFAEIDQLLRSGKKLADDSEQMTDVSSGSELVKKLKKNHVRLGEARALNAEMKKKLNIDGLVATVNDRQAKLVNDSEQLLVALRKKTDDLIKSLTDENQKRIKELSNDPELSLIRTGDNVPEELQKFPVDSFRRDVEMNHLYDQIDESDGSHLPKFLLDWWHNERELAFLSELADGKKFDIDAIRARLKKPITKVYSGDSLAEYFRQFPDDGKLVAELPDFPDDILPSFFSRFKTDWKRNNWLLYRDGYRHYRELTFERKRIEIIESLTVQHDDAPSLIVQKQERATVQLIGNKHQVLNYGKLWDLGQEGDGVFESSSQLGWKAIINTRSEIITLSQERNYLKEIDKDKLIDLWNSDSIDNTIPTTVRQVKKTSELENFTATKQQLDEAKNKYAEAVSEVERLDKDLKETEYLLLSSDSELKTLMAHRQQLTDDGNKKFQQAMEKLTATSERHRNEINNYNNNLNNDKVLAGSAVVLTTIATFIDGTSRYIWGYDQRQLNKHWQRIFSQDDSKLHRVEDVTKILKTIAKSRNYTINPEALALSN